MRSDKNNIVTEDIRIPVSYSSKDSMIARVTEDPKLDRKTSTPTLPLIAFEMKGEFTYDGLRKLQSINRVAYVNDGNSFKFQYTPVPYNIGFKVYIFVKNNEDGLKIIEQILPYFKPDWTPSLKLIPEVEEIRDIPVILNSVSCEDKYLGDLKSSRTIIWTLDLILKGYIYGPVNIAPIIKFANTSFYAGNSYAFSNIVEPGLTIAGLPTSNSSTSIPNKEILATDDFGFITSHIIADE